MNCDVCLVGSAFEVRPSLALPLVSLNLCSECASTYDAITERVPALDRCLRCGGLEVLEPEARSFPEFVPPHHACPDGLLGRLEPIVEAA